MAGQIAPDEYTKYELGIKTLLASLRNSTRAGSSVYAQALTFQARLEENITKARLYGSKGSSTAERAEIINRLNGIASGVFQKSFLDICDEAAALQPLEPFIHLPALQWRERADAVRGWVHRLLRPAAALIGFVGILTLLFLVWVFPAAATVHWVPVAPSHEPSKAREAALESYQVVLRRSPNEEVYTQVELLSTDAYPTTLDFYLKEGKTTYAGTYGAGIYASSDDSEWKFIGLENTVVTQVIVDSNQPGSVFAATNLGIWTTQDNGATWHNLGPTRDLITSFSFMPGEPSVLLAGTTQGLFRSEDRGHTWIGPDLADEAITAVRHASSDGRRVYVSCLYGAVYRSDDAGRSWQLVRAPDGIGSVPIALDPRSADTIYAGPSNQGIFRSEDGGRSWHYRGLNGLSVSAILITSGPFPALFLGTDDEQGLFVSWDEGQTWQNHGVLRDTIFSITEDPSEPGTVIVATARAGLLKTRDGGRTWDSMGLARPRLDLDFPVLNLLPLPDSPLHLLAIPKYEEGIFESSDGGTTWSPVPGIADLLGLHFERVTLNPSDPRQIFASAYGGAVFRSEDGGRTWSAITANLPLGGYAPIAVTSDGTVFAGPGEHGVWKRLRDSGEWQPTGLGIAVIRELWIDPTGTTVYALDETGPFYMSFDGGDRWGTAPHTFVGLAVDTQRPNQLIGVTTALEIVVSNDAGITWQLTGQLNEESNAVKPLLTEDAYRPGAYHIVSGLLGYQSTDGGRTWQEFSLPGTGRVYATPGQRLYLNGSHGLFYRVDQGQDWTPVQRSRIVTNFTAFDRLPPDTLLAATSSAGLFVRYGEGSTWRQTSIGQSNKILDLWVDETARPPRAFALVEGVGELYVAVTIDAKVWQVEQMPCQARASYFESITTPDGPQWQLACQDPAALFVRRLPTGLEWAQIALHGDVSRIIDALYLSNGTTYVITADQGNSRIWVRPTGSMMWEAAGGVGPTDEWELSNDTRSESVLITRLDGTVVRSLDAVIVPPRSTWVTYVVGAVFLALMALNLPLRRRVMVDGRRIAAWTAFATWNHSKPEISGFFAWVVSPLLLLVSLVTFQMLPLESTFRSEVYELENRSSLVAVGTKALLRFSGTLLTSDSVAFVSVMVIIVGTIFLASVLMVLTLGIMRFDALTAVWTPVWRVMFSATASSFMAIVVIGIVLAQLSSNVIIARSLIVGLLAIYYCRLVSLGLHTLVSHSDLARRPLVLVYFVSTIILAFSVQGITSRMSFPAQPTLETLRGDLPVMLRIFCFINLLIVAYFALRDDRRRSTLSKAHR